MLGNDLRNRVFDAQIVFLRTVDRQHRQVFDAQRCGGSSVGLLFGSAGNDQHHFAARRLVDHALANLRDGSATDLLKILGKFTAKRHLAVRTEHVKQVGHGIVDAMQGFVKHDGAAFRTQGAQVLHAFGMLARQESFIAEAVGGQS